MEMIKGTKKAASYWGLIHDPHAEPCYTASTVKAFEYAIYLFSKVFLSNIINLLHYYLKDQGPFGRPFWIKQLLHRKYVR